MNTYDARNDWQYDPKKYSTPFLGYKAGQSWDDLLLWEKFFNEQRLGGVFELGTGGGGLSIFLALECYQRGVAFATLDSQDWFNKRGLPALLGMTCHIADLWSDGLRIVGDFIRDSWPLCLFCDDGDKPREWATFGPMLKPGDFIAVHDWGVEFTEKDMGTLPFKMIMQAECEEMGSITRWFRREK